MRATSALWRGILWGLGCVSFFGAQAGSAHAAKEEPAAALAVVAGAQAATTEAGLDSASTAALALSFWPNAAPSLLIQADKSPRLLLPPQPERPLSELTKVLDAWRPPTAAPRCAVKDALQSALAELAKLPQKPRLVVLLLNDPEAQVCGLSALTFREQDSRLSVIGATTNEQAAAWQELALQSGGHYANCAGAKDTDGCLFGALRRIQPGLEDASPYFSLDTGTTKLSLFLRGQKGTSVKVQIPNSPPQDLTSRLALPGTRETLVRSVAGGYLLSATNPPAGAWRLQNLAAAPIRLFAEQTQNLELVLPRRHFLDSESLLLAVYRNSEGRIKQEVHGLKDVGCEARLFGLAAISGAVLAGGPLQDDGKAPDKAAGDGVFSGAVPLKGLLGPLTLDVSCQSALFIGHIKLTIEVRHGDFLKRENEERPLAENKAETLLFAADPLSDPEAEGPVRYFIQLTDEEPQALAEALGKPGHFVGRLIPLAEPGLYPLTLIAKRGESPLLDDLQTARIKLRVVADTETKVNRILLFGGLGLAVLLLAGLAFGVRRFLRKKPKEAEQILLEVPKAESLSEKPKAPEPESTFLRIEEGDDVELPSAPEPAAKSKIFVEDVSQRIGEVVSVHAAEPIKGDIERPALDQQALDNDGDSSRVSGLIMEKVKTWLDTDDAKQEAKSSEAPSEAPATAAEEGTFKGLNSEDMDEIFGPKEPPKKNS